MIPVVVEICTEATRCGASCLAVRMGHALPIWGGGALIRCAFAWRFDSSVFLMSKMQAEASITNCVLTDPQSKRWVLQAIHQLAIVIVCYHKPAENSFFFGKKPSANSLLVAGRYWRTPMLPMAQQLEKMVLPLSFINHVRNLPETAAFSAATGKKFICYKNCDFHYSQGWFWSHGVVKCNCRAIRMNLRTVCFVALPWVL